MRSRTSTHLILRLGHPVWIHEESHINGMTGHAEEGKRLYRRYCIGCHGPDGNGEGMNAQWIDPKPRDFTEATFKCRSTPTGTLPTDDDSVQRHHARFRHDEHAVVAAFDAARTGRSGGVHQDLVTALGQRETWNSADHSAGNAYHD